MLLSYDDGIWFATNAVHFVCTCTWLVDDLAYIEFMQQRRSPLPLPLHKVVYNDIASLSSYPACCSRHFSSDTTTFTSVSVSVLRVLHIFFFSV